MLDAPLNKTFPSIILFLVIRRNWNPWRRWFCQHSLPDWRAGAEEGIFRFDINMFVLCSVIHFASEKADSAAKSALDLPHIKLGVPIMILSIVSANTFFPLGKMIGMVRSRTSFILSSQSWEIAVLLQAVQEGWSCLVSYPHRSYTSDPFIHLEERSSTFCLTPSSRCKLRAGVSLNIHS